MREELRAAPGYGEPDYDAMDGTDADYDDADLSEVPITGGTDEQHAAALEGLCKIYDPEIPVNIFDLGLIYSVEFLDEGRVKVVMTLTSPGCPAAGILPGEVEERISLVDGVRSAEVEVVWEPPWTPHRMSEAARLELGMF